MNPPSSPGCCCHSPDQLVDPAGVGGGHRGVGSQPWLLLEPPSDKDNDLETGDWRADDCFTLVGDGLVWCGRGREELDVGKECVVSSERPVQPDVFGGDGDLLPCWCHRGQRRGRQRP